jgi:carbohydrate kinase (thermoresistant glucokinase family)
MINSCISVHSKSNRDKMTHGTPLNDADKWDWLILLREEAINHLRNSNGVVVTCSVLKKNYRDVIRVAVYDHPSVQVHFIYLKANEPALRKRVQERKGHYMKSSMVHSQFESLEEPHEEREVLTLDVRASPAEVQNSASKVAEQRIQGGEEDAGGGFMIFIAVKGHGSSKLPEICHCLYVNNLLRCEALLFRLGSTQDCL